MIVTAASTAASKVSDDLAESVANAIRNANNTGTNARLRRFLSYMGFNPQGLLKKALSLRNTLFHDGYLQRRFSLLTRDQQQERYDQLQLLREFLMRVIFAPCQVDVPLLRQ
jgi:hypothetical protein